MYNFHQRNTHALQKLLSLFVLLTVCAEIARGHNFARNVSIPGLGVLVGSYNSHSEVISFLGIPYAEAPIGELRFRLPKPISWNETRNATSEPPGCMQKSPKQGLPISEDCLYLNVFVPGNITDTDANLPVMVWIHGGGFKIGSANEHDVKALVKRGDVIVVTLNYRLNIFGFLSSGDASLPGNAGLHDQVMALKWVKADIQPFGGDPDKITIFGFSAGATSIYILLASPNLPDGLFARAIMQSGLIMPYSDPKVAFRTIANLTSCPHEHVKNGNHSYSTGKQIECMQSKTPEELLAIVTDKRVRIGPVTDNVFITSNVPAQLAAKKNGVPCLIGLNNHEVVLDPKHSIQDMDALKKRLGSLEYWSFTPTAVQLMLSKYLKNDLNNTYMDVFNSRLVAFIHNLTMLVSGPEDAFLYYFTHHPSFSAQNDYVGARHSDELPFVFGNVFKNSSASADEKMLSEDMIAIWSSFARDGVPTLPNGGTWPPYEKTNRSYVELNVNITADNVKQRLRESDRILWNELMPTILAMTSKPKEVHTKGMTMTMTTTTMSPHMHHHVKESIAWGMSEQAVQDLLLSLLICLIFMTVICVTLLVILCKVRTIKLAGPRQNGVVGISAIGGNSNKAFANEIKNLKSESITAL